MKKLFLLFAAATLFVGVQACKQKEAATEEVVTEEVVTEEAPVEAVATDSAAAPVAVDSTAK